MNRTCEIQPLGEVDEEEGEFWVANPFMMPSEGHNLSAYERNRMFLNTQSGNFLDASVFSGCDIDSDSRSVVAADFNRDGRTDLLVGSVGGGPIRLFLNRLHTDAHTVRLILKGTAANSPAIGAKVTARCGDFVYHRDVFCANGFAGQGPPELIMGIGTATQIDELQIAWPSGMTTVLKDLPANSEAVIIEGKDAAEIVERASN